MTDTNVSGATSAGDAQDNRYAGLILDDGKDPEPQAETPEVKEAEATETETQETETEEPVKDEDESQEEVKKPKKGGFVRKLERLEAELAELRAERAKQAEQPQEKAAELKEPSPDDFEEYTDYVKALAKYEIRQELEAEKVQSREDSLRKEMATKAEMYKAKAAELAKTIPDYEDVISDYDGPVSAAMQQVLLESDVGPEVAYYLAKNPEEGKKAASMNLVELNRLVGRIEAKLEMEKSQKVVKKQTSAPAPLKPVSNARTAKTWSLNDEGIPYDEYVRLRGSK